MRDNILPLLERVLESSLVVMKVIGLELPDVFITVGRVAWDWNIADLTNWTVVGWVVATLTNWDVSMVDWLVEFVVVSTGLEFTGISVISKQNKKLHVQ